jgi:bifunctional enzyme CysN/CysC
MTAPAHALEPVETFIEQYLRRDMLRLLTCGSVDDGKSTLIGRLLHDSSMIYDDQLQAVRRDSVRHGTTGGEIDLALLVDGLQAEREQGITIDVAYRYFSTPRRKFIIADTPGHEQYTRNMATGASNCDLAVILVDATRGVLNQTRRHSFIAALLGIRHLVLAVNKMDLVGWSEERFQEIREDFTAFAAKLQISDVHFLPLSALRGDNVVHPSGRMPWYSGGPLLPYLESVHIASDRNLIDLRFPVQLVVRPDASFRGYAGTLASGILRRGDEVMVVPSGRRSRVRSVLTLEGDDDQAFSPMPITVTLTDDVDVSRGDMLVHPNNVPRVEQELEAMLVWMSDDALHSGREYVLKQTTVVVPAVVSDVRYRINVNTLHREPCETLELNEIGRVRIETPRRLAFDAYVRNRATGAFILIDRLTNATIAAGMILDRDPAQAVLPHTLRTATGDPTAEEWAMRLGQAPLSIRVTGRYASAVAAELRTRLFRRGFVFEVLDVAALRHSINADLDRTDGGGDLREEARRIGELRAVLNRLAIGTIHATQTDARTEVAFPTGSGETQLLLDAADPQSMADQIDHLLSEHGLPRAVR